MAEKTGVDMVDEMAEVPDMDEFFRRNPSTFTEEDYRAHIEAERKARAIFIEKKKK